MLQFKHLITQGYLSSVAQKTQNFLSTRQRDYLINPARLQGPSLLA